jgi:hypothetical protein
MAGKLGLPHSLPTFVALHNMIFGPPCTVHYVHVIIGLSAVVVTDTLIIGTLVRSLGNLMNKILAVGTWQWHISH